MKRQYSLKRKKEFGYVYRNGKSVACRNLVLIYKKNSTGFLRVGFSVSKKIGNAVVRNRIKRRLRAALDEYLSAVDKNYNIIFIARVPVNASSFTDIKASVEYVLTKAGLVQKP